jgi:hypothetical protein
MKATPHLEEPRCAYLALGDPRERDNSRSDFAQVHAKWRQARAKERAAMAKTRRNRAIAQRWLERHGQGKSLTVGKAATRKKAVSP